MRLYVIWSIVIGVTALLSPVALYLMPGGAILVIPSMVAVFVAWAFVFCRAWYFNGRVALWLLTSTGVLRSGF
jgi:hypothetical protein